MKNKYIESTNPKKEMITTDPSNVQFSITTGQQYKYICPYCGGGFNRPAWTDTSFGGMDVCPLCERGLEKGWNK